MVRTITDVMSSRWGEWESIRIPTLVIYADHGMFTDERKDLFTQRGVKVSRVDLADGSHDAHLDAFDRWIDALAGFIDTR